jgi:hypothetical protein
MSMDGTKEKGFDGIPARVWNMLNRIYKGIDIPRNLFHKTENKTEFQSDVELN